MNTNKRYLSKWMNSDVSDETLRWRTFVQRLLSILIVVAFLFEFSLLLVIALTGDSIPGLTGLRALIDIVIITSTVLLGMSFGDVYNLNLGRKKLDERLQSKRRRVYEKSFQVLVAIISIGWLGIGFMALGGEREIVMRFSSSLGNVSSTGILFGVLSLPAVVAAWDKDS